MSINEQCFHIYNLNYHYQSRRISMSCWAPWASDCVHVGSEPLPYITLTERNVSIDLPPLEEGQGITGTVCWHPHCVVQWPSERCWTVEQSHPQSPLGWAPDRCQTHRQSQATCTLCTCLKTRNVSILSCGCNRGRSLLVVVKPMTRPFQQNIFKRRNISSQNEISVLDFNNNPPSTTLDATAHHFGQKIWIIGPPM